MKYISCKEHIEDIFEGVQGKKGADCIPSGHHEDNTPVLLGLTEDDTGALVRSREDTVFMRLMKRDAVLYEESTAAGKECL